jgi:hypothetical protein
MNRFLAVVIVLLPLAAQAREELRVVRRSYALPAADFLSLSVDARGANVKVENGPPGMVEAVFHIADTLHPPVFDRYEYADSGEAGSFQIARPESGPGPVKGELWEVRIPREMDFVSTLHAGFTDIALWEVNDMMASVDSDSANLVMDMSGLESGRLQLNADALNGDISLYAPRTAEVFVVAECTLGVLTAPGFSEINLDQLADPENDFSYGEHQQGRSWRPAAPGAAKISLLATAARGDVSIILTGE